MPYIEKGPKKNQKKIPSGYPEGILTSLIQTILFGRI